MSTCRLVDWLVGRLSLSVIPPSVLVLLFELFFNELCKQMKDRFKVQYGKRKFKKAPRELNPRKGWGL